MLGLRKDLLSELPVFLVLCWQKHPHTEALVCQVGTEGAVRRACPWEVKEETVM